jgi:hypothetical protein
MKNDDWTKLEKLLDPKTIRRIKDIIILKDEETGNYEIYGDYTIQKRNDIVCVTKSTSDTTYLFGSIKHAITWIILDKRNKILEANRILDLDTKLAGVETDIFIHRKLEKKSKDPDAKFLYLTKLQEDKLKKKRLQLEMESQIDSVYNWQIRKFEEQAKSK